MFYENEYRDHLRSTGRMASTRQRHSYTIRDLAAFMSSAGVEDAKSVTSVHIDAFVRELSGRDYAGKSLAAHLIRIRIYFEFLERSKIIFLSSARMVRIPRYSPGHHSAFTDEEITERLNHFDTDTAMGLRARTILELAYSAALRPREVRALRLSDIDASNGTLFIEQSKNKKDRIVPVGHEALTWVNRYVEEVRHKAIKDEDHDFVFISHKDGGPLTDRGLTWAIEEACRQAGIEAIAIYSMRASAATNMLEAGMGVVHISRLLGHTSIGTTQVYLRTGERHLARLVDERHPRFRNRDEGGMPA